MSILSTVLIAVALLIALPFIAAMFMKSEFSIVRETTINKPQHEVFAYVKQLRNHQHFNKWIMADPALRLEFRGTDGTVGFVSAWDSYEKSVGKGEQEITRIQDNEQIDYEIRFEKPFEGTALVRIDTRPAPGGATHLRWSFEGTRNYMMKVMRVVVNMDKMLGGDMETSLSTLKNNLEQ